MPKLCIKSAQSTFHLRITQTTITQTQNRHMQLIMTLFTTQQDILGNFIGLLMKEMSKLPAKISAVVISLVN